MNNYDRLLRVGIVLGESRKVAIGILVKVDVYEWAQRPRTSRPMLVAQYSTTWLEVANIAHHEYRIATSIWIARLRLP